MARVRTFIAVGLEPALREKCAQLQVKLALDGCEIKWVERKNLHVTLLFLGEIIDRELHNVCRAVASVANEQRPFLLTLEGIGAFPNLRRPRVLWAGIQEGQDVLRELHDALEPPLLELGCYRREERQYTPHVTLGRIEGDADGEQLAERIAELAEWQGGEMEVTTIQVMASELTREGPNYTVLSTVRLR